MNDGSEPRKSTVLSNRRIVCRRLATICATFLTGLCTTPLDPLSLLPIDGCGSTVLRVAQGVEPLSLLRMKPSKPTDKTAVAGCVLVLVYAILLFIHFYRSSGGASSVGLVDGQYVYMSKSAVIRPISEEEYKMFPTQVARIMSAWMGMMATFGL